MASRRLEGHGVIGHGRLDRFSRLAFVERIWKSVKYEEVVCCERHRSRSERGRCFIKDEGRPLGVGLQEQASNRHELHWSRAIVVNVDGKGGARLRQVRFKETNGSKPLMTCRNVLNDAETGTRTSVPRRKVEDICLLLNRRPARRRRDLDPGFGKELRNLSSRCEGRSSSGKHREARVPMQGTGTDRPG